MGEVVTGGRLASLRNMRIKKLCLGLAMLTSMALPPLSLSEDNSPENGAPPPPPPQSPVVFPTIHVSANVPSRFGLDFHESDWLSSGTGASYVSNSTLPGQTTSKGDACSAHVGDPILAASGAKVEEVTDFALPGEMGLTYKRYFHSMPSGDRDQPGWYDNLDYSLDLVCGGTGTQCNAITLYRPDGSNVVFDGVYTQIGVHAQHNNGVASLTVNGDGTYSVQDENGLLQTYSDPGNHWADLTGVKDVSGIGWTLNRQFNSQTNTETIVVTHTSGAQFSRVTPYTAGSTRTVIDPAGNVYSYQMGSVDYAQVTYPGTPAVVIQYKYGGFVVPYPTTQPDYQRMTLTEVDYNGTPYSYTSYDSKAVATGTHLGDGTETVSLNSDSNGVHITNALGHTETQTFSIQGLTSISHPAVATCGATVNSRSYDSNGYLSQTVDNNGNITHYNYAANGQLQTKTEAYGTSLARTTDYVWDANIWLNRPLSVTIEGLSKTTYTYTAENRVASESVTNLTGNGISGQTLTTTYGYTLYSNGMVQTKTVTHPSPNQADVDTYQYDALGNLTSVTNGLGQKTTYGNYNALGEPGFQTGPNGDTVEYTYDTGGRVLTKTTHPNNGSATWNYTYDGFGLTASVTAPDGQVTTWTRNAAKRVTAITHNDKDGTSTESFGYDANGDVTQHTITRGSTTGLAENFSYDALGRIYQRFGQNGQSLTYAYDGNGNVLSITNAAGHMVSYQYDALNRVTKATESGGASPLMPSMAPTINTPGSSATGAYAVSWNSISGATYYLLQEQFAGGAWSTVQNSSALSWSASGKGNGTYGYRVRACNVTGCSGWSATGTVSVAVPPPVPGLSVPGTNATGSYAVSWNSTNSATSYALQQQINGGGWSTVQSGAATGWNASGESTGSYGYRVQACNSYACSAWSATGTANVTIPVPGLSVPATNGTGSYTVSWGGISGATSYVLQQQVNGGGWSAVASGAATSWNASGESTGNYGYRVQACIGSGCSIWSATSTVSVTIPVPSVSTPAYNNTGSYAVSWSGISGASSYVLQQQVNGGGWSTVFNGAATSWNASGEGTGNYGYRVQACFGSGCSTWSGTATTNVTIPVPIAINGQSYWTYGEVAQKSGSANTSFSVYNGIWTVANQTPAGATTFASGAIPASAVTVQFTWTLVGAPSGDTDGGGTLSNPASSPVAVGSNPFSSYTTQLVNYLSTTTYGRIYQLRVDFFNAGGLNISSSTCTLKTEITGTGP